MTKRPWVPSRRVETVKLSNMKCLLPRLANYLVLASTLVLLTSCSTSVPSTIALTHLTVIDPATSSLRPDYTVMVSGTQITAVGPSLSFSIPKNGRTIDATGKFLIPGLADMHLHLTGAGEPAGSREFILPLLVANGITTVRDMGGDVNALNELRKEIESHKRLGPQIFITGPYLDGDPPAFQPSIVIRNDASAAIAVKDLKSKGVDFIKVQSRLQSGPYLAIARAARENGIRLVGHVPDSISAGTASDAGQASIEHLTGVLLACSNREDELRRRQLASVPLDGTFQRSQERMRVWLEDLLGSYSPQRAAALFNKFHRNHTAQVPTLPLLIHLAFLTPETDLANDPRMKYIPHNLQTIWDQGRQASMANQSAPDFLLRRKLATVSLSLVRELQQAGVSIMSGTDTTTPNVFPGFSLHEDLFYTVRSGISAMEALQSATSVPAQFLGRRYRQGAIATTVNARIYCFWTPIRSTTFATPKKSVP